LRAFRASGADDDAKVRATDGALRCVFLFFAAALTRTRGAQAQPTLPPA
jgi:hypothetical protein